MNRNEAVDLDFSIPRRQSYAAILMIAYRLYKVLIRQLFPFLLVVLFGGSSKKGDMLMYIAGAVALFGGIYSIISFFKYYFYIKSDKLIVKKGVFKRSTLEIPFDRIQSINFEQNLLHRLFNVVKLNMDTAGSAGSELQLNALNHQMASALSAHILENRSTERAAITSEGAAIQKERSHKEVIFHLTIPQLLKVGVTANHLRSGGLIIFFFFWIWDNLTEMGLDVEERMEDYVPTEELLAASLIAIGAVMVLFVIVAFVISLIRTVLKYYDLKMYRQSDDGFVVESGLLNRREHAAKDTKIQLMTWSQNLLQNWGSIYQMKLNQASSQAVNDKRALQVAGMTAQNLDQVERYLFKERIDELGEVARYGVHSYYRYKKIFWRTVFFVPLIGGLYFMEKQTFLICVVVLYLIMLISAHLSYKKKTYALSDNLLLITGGTWGSSATKMLLHKMQSVRLLQTPFQRRRGLASLVLHTASGALRIPDIAYEQCLTLKNYLLYRVESSQEEWL